MLEELEAQVAVVERMSTDIAHDLKTPISRLFVSLDEAIALADAGEPVTECLTEAQSELLAINATFDALLRLARIERRRRDERFGEVALSTLLASVVESWLPVAEERGRTLVLDDRTDGEVRVTGDADLLTQLVVNLVTNALNHGSHGTRVAVVLESSDTAAKIGVHDDGPGIPLAEHENVFRRLYRLDASRSTPGHGLGLSLVKAIARLHEGTTTLSDNAPGLVATVELPRAGQVRASRPPSTT